MLSIACARATGPAGLCCGCAAARTGSQSRLSSGLTLPLPQTGEAEGSSPRPTGHRHSPRHTTRPKRNGVKLGRYSRRRDPAVWSRDDEAAYRVQTSGMLTRTDYMLLRGTRSDGGHRPCGPTHVEARPAEPRRIRIRAVYLRPATGLAGGAARAPPRPPTLSVGRGRVAHGMPHHAVGTRSW